MKTALRLLLAPYRFSVDRLFRMGEVGWAHWFDEPSLYPGGNHLYLYQDSAGTTPVTAVGQTIGLSLDRAYGGRTNASLLANGAAGLTGTATAASYNTSTYAGSVSRAGDASNQSWVTWTGLATSAIHRIRITNTGATSLDVRNGGVAGTIVASISAGATSYVHPLTSGGSTSITITATSNSTTATFTLSEFASIPGTHFVQATSTARPKLEARVNLLLDSEDFSSASWTKAAQASITANQAVAPNGTTTADLWTALSGGHNAVTQVITAAASTQHRASLRIKYVSGSPWVRVMFSDGGLNQNRIWVNVQTGAEGTKGGAGTATFTSASASMGSDGWVTVTINGAIATTASRFEFICQTADNTTVQAAGSFYIWGADLRTTDDAAKNLPAYQRVGATAADHDTDGFPHGQYPDGTDDNQTTTTGGGGTTGFFYCGAITVSGGAGTARTIWSDTGTNTGYRVRINSSNKLELAAGNGTAYTTVQSNETITAPGTYILSAWDDGGVLAVQVNDLARDTTTRPSVSAGTSTITTYKDNGASSSYFIGRDYGSVYRQSYPGESQHAQLKRWLKNVARLP